MTVANFQGSLNGVLDFVWLGLPCSETDGGNLGSSVEGEGLTESRM